MTEVSGRGIGDGEEKGDLRIAFGRREGSKRPRKE